MKKILLVVSFCFLFTINVSATDFSTDVDSIIEYDDMQACYIQNPLFTGDDVVFTPDTIDTCLTSIESLDVEEVEGEFIYTHTKIYLTNEGTNKVEIKEATSTSGDETIDTLEWLYITTGLYNTPINPNAIYETYPDVIDTWYIIPDTGVTGISHEDASGYTLEETNADGTLVTFSETKYYDTPYPETCAEIEDSSIYPLKSVTENTYYDNGNIESSYVAEYALNTDCTISEEMALTSTITSEYYESGVIKHEIIETYENGEVVSTVENNYDTNGNLIVEEPIVTPVAEEPVVTPVVEDPL